MIALLLLTGIVGKQAEEQGASKGWVEVIRSRSRSSWKEEREEIRETIAGAMGDNTPEAAALLYVVAPFVKPKAGDAFSVDWGALRAELASVRAAIAEYEAAEAEDDEDFEFLMMAA